MLSLILLIDLSVGVEELRLMVSLVFASVGEMELEWRECKLGSKII